MAGLSFKEIVNRKAPSDEPRGGGAGKRARKVFSRAETRVEVECGSLYSKEGTQGDEYGSIFDVAPLRARKNQRKVIRNTSGVYFYLRQRGGDLLFPYRYFRRP